MDNYLPWFQQCHRKAKRTRQAWADPARPGPRIGGRSLSHLCEQPARSKTLHCGSCVVFGLCRPFFSQAEACRWSPKKHLPFVQTNTVCCCFFKCQQQLRMNVQNGKLHCTTHSLNRNCLPWDARGLGVVDYSMRCPKIGTNTESDSNICQQH
jgi:hypothetical protein